MAPTPGAFIWYELMTTDINAAARFYGAVIGWQIPPQPGPGGGDRDYRMIVRSDGTAWGDSASSRARVMSSKPTRSA